MLKYIHMRRAGLYLQKIGMMSVFNEEGFVTPVTVLKKIDFQIIDKNSERMWVLFLDQNKKLKNPQQKMLEKKNIESKSGFIREMELKEDIDLENFKNVKYVDVFGRTKGKGYTGTMKRWNFSGGRGSHGASKSHRTQGSTGLREGKTYKGRKMAGRYGFENVVQQNLKIVRIDKEVLLVKGAVPGPNKNILFITKSVKKINNTI